MFRSSPLVLVGLIASLAACDVAPAHSDSRSAAKPAAVLESAKPASRPASDSKASTKLGAPISAPEVTLADIAKNPAGFEGRPFTTNGTVSAVCQEMGCWMEIKDAEKGAHLRMHGHAFYIPKTASGHRARVQATLLPGGQMANACSDEGECASKDHALLQLDATGVEID